MASIDYTGMSTEPGKLLMAPETLLAQQPPQVVMSMQMAPMPQQQQQQFGNNMMAMQPSMVAQASGGAFNYNPQMVASTTIVVQPDVQQLDRYDLTGIRDWSSGVCDCFNNCCLCLYGFCCFECLVCDVTHSMNEGLCLGCCCGAGAGPIVRTSIRHRYRIKGTLASDLAVFLCCEDCLSWQQLYRELKYQNELNPCCPWSC